MMVDGQAVPLKAGDVIFIPPMVKYIIVNNSSKDSRFLEIYTHPPFTSDIVRVQE